MLALRAGFHDTYPQPIAGEGICCDRGYQPRTARAFGIGHGGEFQAGHGVAQAFGDVGYHGRVLVVGGGFDYGVCHAVGVGGT